jgi:hypothetical protein
LHLLSDEDVLCSAGNINLCSNRPANTKQTLCCSWFAWWPGWSRRSPTTQLPSQPATSTHCAAQWTPATASLFTSRLGSCCNVCFTDRMHTCRWTEVKMNSCMRGSGGAWDGTNYMQHPAFCPLLDFFLLWSNFYVLKGGLSNGSVTSVMRSTCLMHRWLSWANLDGSQSHPPNWPPDRSTLHCRTTPYIYIAQWPPTTITYR